jgi:membrane protease YdiL (CAAX protease family)
MGHVALAAESAGYLLLLGFYVEIARRTSRLAILATQPFGIPDAACAGVLGLWMISVIAQSVGTAPVITLPSIVANSVVYLSLVAGIVGVMGFRRLSVTEVFGLSLGKFPKAAATGLIWLVITYPLILATQFLVQRLIGSADDSQAIVRYFLTHPDLKHRAAIILMAVVVAPVAEEVLFRGYLYGVIRRYCGRIAAIAVSSLLFAAIHVHLPSAPGLLLLAVTLCLLLERTGSLWATITMHSLFNASTIAMLIFFPELAG